jgi:hypothetical protein
VSFARHWKIRWILKKGLGFWVRKLTLRDFAQALFARLGKKKAAKYFWTHKSQVMKSIKSVSIFLKILQQILKRVQDDGVFTARAFCRPELVSGSVGATPFSSPSSFYF